MARAKSLTSRWQFARFQIRFDYQFATSDMFNINEGN